MDQQVVNQTPDRVDDQHAPGLTESFGHQPGNVFYLGLRPNSDVKPFLNHIDCPVCWLDEYRNLWVRGHVARECMSEAPLRQQDGAAQPNESGRFPAQFRHTVEGRLCAFNVSDQASMISSLERGEPDQSADDRNVLDDVDDLIRAGHGIANEWSVDRDRCKDEEYDQRDGHVAGPHIEEQAKATRDLDSVDRGQKKRRGWKTDGGQDCRGLSKGKDFPQTRRDKEERD